ncbi:MAG: helix-turn-helix transcriptional regulator [Cyanobacteria bacterium P01_A01_bin.40]
MSKEKEHKNNHKVVVLTPLQLELLIVLIVGEAYGLEILDRINKARDEVGMRKLRIGSLYPTLKRLEEANLIKSELREEVAGNGTPRRKYYEILAEGQTAISRTKAYYRLLSEKSNSDDELIPSLPNVLSLGYGKIND